MSADKFRDDLLAHLNDFRRTLSSDQGDWTVKGFIDIYRNIYTVSVDTKVVSKIFELMLFPILSHFAAEHGYRLVQRQYQEHRLGSQYSGSG